MAYPLTIDAPDTAMQGTTLVSVDDHALSHRVMGSAIPAIEQVLGTTAGTSIAKNFAASDFAARINASNVLQQPLTGTLGMSAGTVSGQIVNSGTVANGVYGTAQHTGGTLTSMAFNGGTLGTPTVGSIVVPGTVAALGFSAAIAPGVGTIVDSAGGTLTVNAQQGQIFYSAMGTAAGNRTIGTPLNPSAYQQLTYAFKASGSANGTLVWATTIFRYSQDSGTPALGTGTTWNYFSWRYNFIDSKWDYLGQSRNII